jgi:hypothetical protein
LGAAHQTGWTGLVAKLLVPRRSHPIDRPQSPTDGESDGPEFCAFEPGSRS